MASTTKRLSSCPIFEEEDSIKRLKLESAVLVFCKRHPSLLFNNIWELAKHCKNEKCKTAACGLCNDVFDLTADLSSHIKSSHRNQLNSKCPLCTFIPARPSQLEEHRLSFHQGAPF